MTESRSFLTVVEKDSIQRLRELIQRYEFMLNINLDNAVNSGVISKLSNIKKTLLDRIKYYKENKLDAEQELINHHDEMLAYLECLVSDVVRLETGCLILIQN